MRQSGSLKQHTTRVLKRGSLALSILAAAFLPQWRRAGVSVANAASSYPETQFIGLEVLYNTTGGEQWTSSTGWRNPTLGVCSWYGITCDVYGENVTGLSLAGNRLDGNLSQAGEFFEMVSLQKVDLSNNRLVGPVPSGFGVMPNLQVLDLSGNGHASFPADWGSEAVSLQHLFLQRNSISGTLPSEWLVTNGSRAASYPIVHSEGSSAWLPELRTLALGGNSITMTVYHALQSVTSLSSLQTLDLSENALSGDFEGCFELRYCEENDSLLSPNACDATIVKTGASVLAVLLLASNVIEGELKEGALPSSLSVMTVSDNFLHGPVPDDFSQLSVFFAEGNGKLNDTALPNFASYANSSAELARHGNLSCPALSGQHVKGRGMRLKLDASYLDYVHCVCAEGMEGDSNAGCHACPEGTYRGASELFSSRSCLPCPANSGTLITGADSASYCKCEQNFYDFLSGGADGPECSACPSGGFSWAGLGAISVAACSCPAGFYLNDAVSGSCTACAGGTYKASVGNSVGLCLPCAKGTYSAETGGTAVDVCTPCGAGTYSEWTGASSSSTCEACPRGTYSASVGSFSSDLCERCPAGYYSEAEGATDSELCVSCPRGTYSPDAGASSADACLVCADGVSSLAGSKECTVALTNSRRTLIIYLIVGGSTLTGICIIYYTWQKKVHKKKKLMVDRRTETPLKVTIAKRKAHMWAVFFHTLETVDVIAGNALFGYLLEIGAVQGFLQYLYWLVVFMGAILNVYRLGKVIWMQCLLRNISVEENIDKEGKPVLVGYIPVQWMWMKPKDNRRIMAPEDAKMVPELVKILKHLQVNKFKVQLAVVMDLPLTFLNLYLLCVVEPNLIQSPLFLTSLIIAVFSAGKISTLIEYHLELRQRKRKLERLLMLELKSSTQGSDDEDDELQAGNVLEEHEDDCFEHGNPVTLLKFHGQSMRNIASKESQESPKAAKGRRRRYLRLSPSRLSPKGASRANVNEATADGNGLSRRPRKGWVTSPLPSPKRESPPRPPRQHHLPHRVPQEAQEPKQSEKTPDTVVKPQAAVVGGGDGGQ